MSWRPRRPPWWGTAATRGQLAIVVVLVVFGVSGVSLWARVTQLEDQRARDHIALDARQRSETVLCRQVENLSKFLTFQLRRGGIKVGRKATDCRILSISGRLVPLEGKAGSPGAKGLAGATGIGTPGVQGGIGRPGNPGKSIVGPPGPRGATGAASTVAGPKGDTGAASTVPGPRGETGAQGDRGATGADSTVPGPTGDTGATGPQGPQGDPGPQGPPGAPAP